VSQICLVRRRKVRGDLIAVFHCFKDDCGENRGRLFSEAAREIVTRTRGKNQHEGS